MIEKKEVNIRRSLSVAAVCGIFHPLWYHFYLSKIGPPVTLKVMRFLKLNPTKAILPFGYMICDMIINIPIIDFI